MVMLKVIESYKKLRLNINVKNNHPLEGDLKLSEDNVKLIKEGVGFGIVSNEIIVDKKTYLSENLVASEIVATITLLPQLSPGLENIYISESKEKFFAQFCKYFKIPTQLYVHEIYSQPYFDEDKFVGKLNFAIKVREILTVLSDYEKKFDACDELFLHAANPLILNTAFSDDNFDEHIKKAEKILELISSDFRSEIFISFLKIEIIKLLEGVEEINRFSSLLNNFKTVYINFNNSTILYFKEFDFQKSKMEIQNSKIDLIKKIHGVVNELGGKLITIPAAYLLILASLKFNNPISAINSVYLFSAIMYCLIIESSITNQFFLLGTLNNDIDDFINHDLKKGKLVKIFDRYKIELTKSYSVQKNILWLIRIILWLLPLALIAILTYVTIKY